MTDFAFAGNFVGIGLGVGMEAEAAKTRRLSPSARSKPAVPARPRRSISRRVRVGPGAYLVDARPGGQADDLNPEFMGSGSDTSKLASARLECRSLLAGDSEHPQTDHTLGRLQAGSYRLEKKQRTR
jgi:hypothetical protein